MDATLLSLAALSYLAGGIPTGYLVAWRLKGIDIRRHGSGNPGAANVYRVVGLTAGLVTLLVDAAKGFVPALLARHFYPDAYGIQILCGSLAIVGHVWTVFLGFKGGKAVATSAGVFLALLPKPLLTALAVFIAGFALTGHISVGSMAAAAAFPLMAWGFGAPSALVAMAACVCALILVRHLSNLKRLLAGSELFVHGDGLEKHGK